MEQILRILKQLTGSAGALGTIPKPIKVSLTVFGAFVGVVVIFKYAKLDQSEKTFLIIAIVLLGLITAVYYAWKAWTLGTSCSPQAAGWFWSVWSLPVSPWPC